MAHFISRPHSNPITVRYHQRLSSGVWNCIWKIAGQPLAAFGRVKRFLADVIVMCGALAIETEIYPVKKYKKKNIYTEILFWIY